MFERFTQQARQTVVLAREEARRCRHPALGTEHLLVGLLADGRGPAAQALRDRGVELDDVRRRIVRLLGDELDPGALAAVGIDLDQVRRATEASFGPGALDPPAGRPIRAGHLPLTRRAKKALELSLREAVSMHHTSIGSGHILLGLLREGDGLATRVLLDTGVDLAALRADVTRRIVAAAA